MATFTSDDIDLFLASFPQFIKLEEHGKICLSGISVIEADEKQYEFEIKICSSERYPFRFPKVFEISDRIKKIADWHVNSDESFCFTVEPVEIIACKNRITLLDFYTKWLIPYLSNQQYRINEGKYANGEYSHNFMGIYEYYSELLCTKSIFEIVLHLNTAFLTKKIERTSICYCGSNKKYRHCHKKAMVQLWDSGDAILLKHLTVFQALILKLNPL